MGRVLAAVLLAGCSGDAPPTLPGEEDPPCNLAEPRNFLVTSINPEDPDTVDLSQPPDGTPDNLDYPYTYIQAAVGSALSDALARALNGHRIVWVITVQTCQGSDTYARVALRQGTTVEATAPLMTVTLAMEQSIWAVGTSSASGIDATQGVGVVPVAAPVDAQADLMDGIWFPFYMFVIHAQLGANGLSGSIAGAVETAVAAPAVADAVARSLTIARAADPPCPPTCQNSALADLIRVFDTNNDGVFTGSEVLSSGGLDALGYFPNLDLLVHDSMKPIVWPAHDHIAESLGNGYLFQAVEVVAR